MTIGQNAPGLSSGICNVVVLPTYNEALNIERMVLDVLALGPEYGVLVVDDSSPDGTGGIVNELAREQPGRVELLVRTVKEGLGAAYREGFRAACAGPGRVVIQMDADGSHPVSRIPAMVAAVERGAGVVIGSRYVPGGSLDESWPLSRKALSRGGNLYAQLLLGLPVKDLTGGFKAWRRNVLADLDLEAANASGYAFQIQTTLLASLGGATVEELPIHFAERQHGASKMTTSIALEAITRVWTMARTARTARRS